MKAYELIDHTADICIKAYGKDISQAFAHAAQAMFDIITDNSTIDTVGEYTIVLEASDLEQLLVDWLSELLFLNSAKNLVFGSFQIDIEGNQLTAHVCGEHYDTSKHGMGVEIKAVTYHMVEVKQTKPVHVQVLFDI